MGSLKKKLSHFLIGEKVGPPEKLVVPLRIRITVRYIFPAYLIINLRNMYVMSGNTIAWAGLPAL